MSLEQLKRRLRREVQANPKKAAMLGLLVLVGCYFWAPLIAGLFGGEEEPTLSSGPEAASTATAGGSGAARPEPQRSVATVPWQQRAEWLERHPWKSPAGATPAWTRNPFRLTEELQQRFAQEDADDDPEERELASARQPGLPTPDELGLTLSSTVVGPRQRMALIGGKIYQEGDTIEVTDDVAFVVLHIQPGSVVLGRGAEQYELAVRKSG